MTLASRSFVAVLIIGSAAVIGYLSFFTSGDSDIAVVAEQLPITELSEPDVTEDSTAEANRAMDAESVVVPTAALAVASTVTADTVSKWTADADSDDPQARATAISALAAAPKVQAVPVLQKLIGTGAEEDRQLALSALRTIALTQGDADGEIRNVLRLTLYDGDSEIVAIDAQAALDELDQMATNQGS